ncbi:MAG: AtpZ/AtpI family protein [Thermoleophilia bacterium]|nr:AtpZ/AtpI family protein [Thermoleophilia bacterium]
MSAMPTEERPDGDKSYRGEERRQAERRTADRRYGERRISDRRQKMDLTGPGSGGRGRDSRKRDHSRFWYDFMRFNLTGWSVVIPTLAGLAIGNWIDNRYTTSFSWALALMATGLFLGCLNAWYWIRRQDDREDR